MRKNFNFKPTPLIELDSWSKEFNCEFFMKRDDLFQSGGGGSKARMLEYILWEARCRNADYILTAGGPYSNFNRALALMGTKYGFKIRLVLYNKNQHLTKYSLNKKILDYCNIEIVECDPNFVKEQIEIEKTKIEQSGFIPYYIWGGGKSKQGVQAYYDAYHEIYDELGHVNYLFTALGTGTTYSGLYAGSKSIKNPSKVIGFSVAREKHIAKSIVHEILNDYFESNSSFYKGVDISDEFLSGGYGKTTKEMRNFISEFIKKQGIIIDSIYVGKALFATYNYMKTHKTCIKNKKLVFLNSGGIFNF